MPFADLNMLWMPILVPMVAGILALAVSRLRNEFSLIGTVATLYYAIRIFLASRHGTPACELISLGPATLGLRADGLSAFVLLVAVAIAALVVLYSFRYMRGKPAAGLYYFLLLFTVGCAAGVFLASNLIVLLVFWGLLAALLYGMLFIGPRDSSPVAMKGLIIAGSADLVMMTGIGLLLFGVGSSEMVPAGPIPLQSAVSIAAFAMISTGALAKAGSMPFHSWIPDAASTAPVPFLSFVPGAVDKLLGVYLLTRVSVNIFDISSNDVVRNVLMTVGAVTILAAVMMALVQKRVMKLLAFHAVSQVGYMVLGIGTGLPIGIAGGLFHMLNNSIYKAGLFLSAGSVELSCRTDNIDELGGLAKQMPLTFVAFLVLSLAIAGVPPLNGFTSKWMVYQGLVELAKDGNRMYPFFLVASMMGSVLTLASFLKLLHSLFLGQRPSTLSRNREVGFAMWLPPIILASVCVLFGVFAYPIPLRGLIYPSLPFVVEPNGIWQPEWATLLVLVSLGLGVLAYLLGAGRNTVTARTFVGGENTANEEEGRVTGSGFYGPVKTIPLLRRMYEVAESGATDFYNLGLKGTEAMSGFILTYVDRTVDSFYTVVSGFVLALGRGLRAAGPWFFGLLAVPLLVYVGTGQLLALRYFAVALMVGGAFLALAEVSFARFMLLISLTQVGFVVLALSRGDTIGFLSATFQFYNSLLAYAAVYLSYRLVTAAGRQSPVAITDFRGVSRGMPVATLGFIVGGLSLAGMPPSGNFFSKYLLSSIYPENTVYTVIIIFVALLMLGAMLRVINQVFFGPARIDYREPRGGLYYASLAVSVLVILNGLMSKPLINLLSLLFGVSVQ
ncbi:MAG TPA: proton-conducting transporter membrane subunit [bacterium]|nr:proton-conducting transporter membrane subunit [bacterium]